jgi:hypothetical protein
MNVSLDHIDPPPTQDEIRQMVDLVRRGRLIREELPYPQPMLDPILDWESIAKAANTASGGTDTSWAVAPDWLKELTIEMTRRTINTYAQQMIDLGFRLVHLDDIKVASNYITSGITRDIYGHRQAALDFRDKLDDIVKDV